MKRPFIKPIDPLPTGSIIIWTSNIFRIPYGYVLCDGNNGTPDLRNKYIQQVSGQEGTTVGSNSITLSTTNLPQHTHPLTIEQRGDHIHQIDGSVQEGRRTSTDQTEYGPDNIYEGETGIAGDHSHTFTLSTVGGGEAVVNEPINIKVHFIQKII